MSILIKGMEMPKNCFDCPCYHHKVDDGYYDYEICRASGTIFNDGYSSVTGHKDHIDPFKARLANCPLIPVPDHGRLIDADALDIYRREEQAWHDYKMYPDNEYLEGVKDGLHEAAKQLSTAPTIIQASGEERE